MARVFSCVTVLCLTLAGSLAASEDSAELNNLGVRAAQEGKFEAGVRYLREAVKQNPQDDAARKNLSGILTSWAFHLEQAGEIDTAEQLLLEAVDRQPDNGTAYVLLGDMAYFKQSDFTHAITYWKRAYSHLSSAERRAVSERIAQAQRDELIERGFVSQQTAHFDIRVQQEGKVALAALGRLLEQHYAALEQDFGRGPSRVAVIVYTQEDLHRTYNQRDWAVGFYDGRLRLLWNEIGTPLADAFIAHELAHAFLHYLYGEGPPIWVHEGFAQLREGERPRTAEEQRLEQGMVSGTLWVPLKWLDHRFTHPSGTEDVARAYVESRMVIAELVKRHGLETFKAFLELLAQGTPVDVAYDRAFTPSRWSRTDQSIVNEVKGGG